MRILMRNVKFFLLIIIGLSFCGIVVGCSNNNTHNCRLAKSQIPSSSMVLVTHEPYEKINPIKATVKPGTIRQNVERIARQYGWPRVVWEAEKNFRVVGYRNISAATLPEAMRSVLNGYPLQAVFYKANHVLVIKPRTIK